MGNRVAIRMNKRPLKSGAEAPHSKTQTPEMAAGIDGHVLECASALAL